LTDEDTSIIHWIEQQGYEVAKEIPLGGKIPDILALKSEIVAIEIKKRADEVTTAIGQCLHYLNECNKVYIALPDNEVKRLSEHTKSTLKSHGIGLINLSKKKTQIVFEAVNANSASIFKLLMSLRKKDVANRITTENFKARIVETLRNNPNGLTILELSNLLGTHRNTITKYVYELAGARLINQRKVSTAKLCFLAEDFEKGAKV